MHLRRHDSDISDEVVGDEHLAAEFASDDFLEPEGYESHPVISRKYLRF